MKELNLAEISNHIEAANRMVDALCDGTRKWVMRVPAQMDDDPDLVIGTALRDASQMLATLRDAQLRHEADPAVKAAPGEAMKSKNSALCPNCLTWNDHTGADELECVQCHTRFGAIPAPKVI